MCLSKYSNIELLKEVAMNLHLSKDHENKDGLCERDLAALINFFYQVSISIHFKFFFITDREYLNTFFRYELLI